MVVPQESESPTIAIEIMFWNAMLYPQTIHDLTKFTPNGAESASSGGLLLALPECLRMVGRNLEQKQIANVMRS